MSLAEKKVDWLYEHFQGITKRSDQFLVLFGVLFVSALAIFVSASVKIELPFLKVEAGRETLLGSMILSAAFTLVAFFGNYDYGERALLELCNALGCEWDDIWFVDTHPTIVDFARFRREASAENRGFFARFSARLLYPVILLSALAGLLGLWGYELWSQIMSPLEAAPYLLAAPVFYVATHRALEYLRRRWGSWREDEKARLKKETPTVDPLAALGSAGATETQRQQKEGSRPAS